MNARNTHATASVERLLGDFAPDFDFIPAPPIPVSEYAERMRKLKREAVSAGLDAVVVYCDTVGWFHAAHAYLRYLCDWMREGVLIIPLDEGKRPVLLSFFTQSVILPPGGEPVGWTASCRSGPWAVNMPILRAIPARKRWKPP